ncbi:MAG: hypothetical protein WDO70_07850 [Alphaproteobacteria bacterium]
MSEIPEIPGQWPGLDGDKPVTPKPVPVSRKPAENAVTGDLPNEWPGAERPAPRAGANAAAPKLSAG